MNGFEPAQTVANYRKSGKFTFPMVLNGKGAGDVAAKYKVAFYPTTYVLDSKGRITARFVGFDDKTHNQLKAALRKQGLSIR